MVLARRGTFPTFELLLPFSLFVQLLWLLVVVALSHSLILPRLLDSLVPVTETQSHVSVSLSSQSESRVIWARNYYNLHLAVVPAARC